MNSNFIKLTDLNNHSAIILNVNFIQSIAEQRNGSSYVIMTFKESYNHFEVKETPKEIMKLMKNKIYS
jgi:hypothetical protein